MTTTKPTTDPYAERYWRGLCDDNLALAAVFIRERQYANAIRSLRAGIRLANRAKDLSRSGRCCAAIRRLHWLIAREPVAPAAPQWMEAA